MTGLVEAIQSLFGGGFSPVTPANVPPPADVPLPRLRPSPVGPVASQQADAGQPRIRMTGAPKANVGGEPIAVEPVTPAGTDGSDPYADVPRLQPRTGIRRFGYNAAAGIAGVPSDADPLSSFADAYLGAQNAEQGQTAAERTAQIDEINRRLERQKYADTQERQQRLDAADLDVKKSTAELNRAKTKAGGGKGKGLTDYQYYSALHQKRAELLGSERLLGPDQEHSPDLRAKAQARVDAQFAAFKADLDRERSGAPADEGGLSQSEAEDFAVNAGEPPVAAGQPGGEGKLRALTVEETYERGDSDPKGAIPDNITGDGSLSTPFRVKNPKDPSIRSKIKVGDHYYSGKINPVTGREEIRIRDR